MLRYLNLSLLILFPIAWFAPLMRAGFLPFFSLDEISIITGVGDLWSKDIFLCLLVSFFALVAPIIKVAGMALVQFGLVANKAAPALAVLGKLAMADVFLIAIYIVVAKGVGVGRLETAWGLYLFTFCVLMSYVMTLVQKQKA
jgi:paraquat-inducible protein A